MSFNSLEFIYFLSLVLCLNFAVPNKYRWIFLLAASIYFYCSWNWEYIFILLFSSGIDYYAALALDKDGCKNRKLWLIASLGTNVFILFIFKYYSFAVENVTHMFNLFDYQVSFPVNQLLLPIGISFYTFQAMSYTIDVYRRKLPAEKNWLRFLLYVTFFPQLVAGPIERSTHLMPLLRKLQKVTYASAIEGLILILIGMMKKVVIADRCAVIVAEIFKAPTALTGWEVLLGTLLFAFQIYADFSAYSDIARGTAKMFGYDLMINFKYPYTSCSMREFWRRWHISLSTWFRDYLYYPLGGSSYGLFRQCVALGAVFLVSGFWHGASWTFVLWGAVNGFAVICEVFISKIIPNDTWLNRWWSTTYIGKFLGWTYTMTFILAGWLCFRAASFTDLKELFFALSRFNAPSFFSDFQITSGKLLSIGVDSIDFVLTLSSISLFFLYDLWKRIEKKSVESSVVSIEKPRQVMTWLVILGLILVILMFGNFDKTIDFIYFQF